jgi:adenine-specific DNA methylase
MTDTHKQRLIEYGFPCHQVGAETPREQSAAVHPPVNRLHVWWARRPLTASRAALLASLLPAEADVSWFLRQLGIEKIEAIVNGEVWTLNPKDQTLLSKLQSDAPGKAWQLEVDSLVKRRLIAEDARREKNRDTIEKLIQSDPQLAQEPLIKRWAKESRSLPRPLPVEGDVLAIQREPADPAHVNERIAFAKSDRIKTILGKELKWDDEDLYGYSRAFSRSPELTTQPRVVLDPTAGGGSIPFEAMRLGHHVIANELNPVATVILYATLDYPARFGHQLVEDIERWGNCLVSHVEREMAAVTPFSPLPESERQVLREHCKKCPEDIAQFDIVEHDHVAWLYCRQVTCPHCGGKAPLLNSCWLAKEGEQWGVAIIPDPQTRCPFRKSLVSFF